MKRIFKYLIILVSFLGVLFSMISAGYSDSNYGFFRTLVTLKYFTIQSNILVVLYFILSLFPNISQHHIFKKAYGAVLIYITVTFLVFATLLQSIWHPVGLALAGDILNHYITPILAILYYLYDRKEFAFAIKDLKFWLIYPLVYLVFLIIHGIITTDYIYPFFDIPENGIITFLIALVGIFILVFILAFSVIFISKIHSKKGEYE